MYKGSMNGEAIPVVDILGVKIAAINMEWLMKYTENNLAAISGNYITVANVHTTVLAYENEEYRAIQNGCVMAIPDGGPLSSIGRKRGFSSMERTTGPSYMEKVLEISPMYGWKHYFYGSTEETLQKLAEVLRKKYPDTKVAGMYSPPFRPLAEQENHQIIDQINQVAPDFVWIGLGAPKQEIWMAQHQGQITGLMVGVGAAFDYLAGNIVRAPEWMQKTNLEWLYRLLQEPKRLFKRYLITNSKFIWHAVIRGR